MCVGVIKMLEETKEKSIILFVGEYKNIRLKIV